MEQTGSVREFARYTLLSVAGMLALSCYILADTFFVSQSLGTNGLAALNLAIPVYNFIHGTGNGRRHPVFHLQEPGRPPGGG